MKEELSPFFTFEKIRARTLVWCSVLAYIISSSITAILTDNWSENETYTFPIALVESILFYCFFILIISSIVFRSRLSYRRIFGDVPELSTLGYNALLVFPLIFFSIVAFFLQDVTLRHLSPELTGWLFDDSFITISPSANLSLLANILSIVLIVIIAPLFEEFFIRGILLTRWSIKWGIPKAIIASSIVFGLLHDNILGSFFFGFVMSILYINTRTLYVPIVVHMLNNLIASSISIYELITPSVSTEEISTERQSLLWIWIWIVAAVLITPWVVNFVRKNIPKSNWTVPYLYEGNS